MAVYLVMRNNLKRCFSKKITYLFIVLIPIFVGGLGIFTNNITASSIRVGVLTDVKEPLEGIENATTFENVQYQIANRESIITDTITGKYNFVIDYAEKDSIQETINEITIAAYDKSREMLNDLSKEERLVAMIMTVYLIIATIYAAKIIQDKESKTLERFCFAGKKKLDYIWGNVISTGIIVLSQVSIAFSFFKIIDINFTFSIMKCITAIGLITIVTTLYGVFMTLLLKKEMNANIAASSLAIILSILGGTFAAVDNMPQVLQVLSAISPIRWIIFMMR